MGAPTAPLTNILPCVSCRGVVCRKYVHGEQQLCGATRFRLCNLQEQVACKPEGRFFYYKFNKVYKARQEVSLRKKKLFLFWYRKQTYQELLFGETKIHLYLASPPLTPLWQKCNSKHLVHSPQSKKSLLHRLPRHIYQYRVTDKAMIQNVRLLGCVCKRVIYINTWALALSTRRCPPKSINTQSQQNVPTHATPATQPRSAMHHSQASYY